MQLPQYTKKDLQILAITMPAVVVLINSLLFGKRFFTDPEVFVFSGLIVLAVMVSVWFLFTWIAVTVRSRLSSNRLLIKRLAITIVLIGIIQALIMTLFFQGYDYFNLFGYELNKPRYYWTLIIGFLLNILITLLHEGIDSFERWKSTLTETEQLKRAYTQSQLLGLKRQVNPHFLFNSLNSLSSLISEDAEKAEKFLDELTKVYRYLLRSHDEKLVPLGTELKFIHSYFYLLKARYGNSIHLKIKIDESLYHQLVSPLLLQTIFEYSLNNNRHLKESPLHFLIKEEYGNLVVQNNIQEKQRSSGPDMEGIYNLIEKYKLLCNEPVVINKTDILFSVEVPLVNITENSSV